MQRVLASGALAAALALGSVTGAATAAATGLPLEPAASAPRSVNDNSTGSAFGHEPSGSALTGPVSTGSAELLTKFFTTFSGDPNCPTLC
jgi:hypothetical protein